MRDQTAELLQERQAARNLASTIEGQRQVAIRNAEQLHRNDREQLQQLESRAEHVYTTIEHKLTAAVRESELDREMLVVTRRQETHANEPTQQVETSAEEMLTHLSGALRSTEGGEARAISDTRQALEAHYQQREAQLRQHLHVETGLKIAQLEQDGRSQYIELQQQAHDAQITLEQLKHEMSQYADQL